MKGFLINLYNIIISLIRNPKIFFKKNNDDISRTGLYLLIILIVPVITTFIRNYYYLFELNVLADSLPEGLSELISYSYVNLSLISLIGGYISNLILILIITVINHFMWRIFNGRGDFDASFRTVVYSSTLYLLFNWVPIINIILFFYCIYLFILGGSINHKITMMRSGIALLTIPVIITLLFIIILIIAAPIILNMVSNMNFNNASSDFISNLSALF